MVSFLPSGSFTSRSISGLLTEVVLSMALLTDLRSYLSSNCRGMRGGGKTL